MDADEAMLADYVVVDGVDGEREEEEDNNGEEEKLTKEQDSVGMAVGVGGGIAEEKPDENGGSSDKTVDVEKMEEVSAATTAGEENEKPSEVKEGHGQEDVDKGNGDNGGNAVAAVEKGSKEAVDGGDVAAPSSDPTITCNPCNLIFFKPIHLQLHLESDSHRRVSKGNKPGFGRNYCFLCWRGYNQKLDLSEHYSGHTHENNCRTHNVKGLCVKISEQEVMEEDEERRRKRGDKYRSYDSRQRPSDRSRSPLRDHGGSNRRGGGDYSTRSERAILGRGLRHCVECNLVFVSERSETLHRESQRHRAVFDRKRPFAPSGKETPFVCFLCWWGYDEEVDLHLHYGSTEHLERMKRYGIEKLLKDSRLEKGKKRRRSGSPLPSCLDGFIILDEVGEDDDEEEVKSEKEGKTEENAAAAPVVPVESAADGKADGEEGAVVQESALSSDASEVKNCDIADDKACEEGSSDATDPQTSLTVAEKTDDFSIGDTKTEENGTEEEMK